MKHSHHRSRGYQSNQFKCIIRTKFNASQDYLSGATYHSTEDEAIGQGRTSMDAYFARYQTLKVVIFEVIDPSGRLVAHKVTLRDEWKREMKLI